MSQDKESLYGVPRPRRKPEHEVSSSTSAAFRSQLTTLLSQSRSGSIAGPGRARTRNDIKLKKDDIFTAHRARKRKADELSRDESGHLHQTQDVIGGVDDASLARSKRKMEDKAKIYAAMKRGDYGTAKSHMYDEDRGPLVDFDRKWAEASRSGGPADSDSLSGEEFSEEEQEMIDYTDEFGRLRKATKTQIEQEERRQRIQKHAAEDLIDLSARPEMPSSLIYGDAVQAAAFNPDAAVERQMEELAARRDRSLTPPEDSHYDATKEIRSKGVGFYQFSKDDAARNREMKELQESRVRTEEWEAAREQNMAKKLKELKEQSQEDQRRRDERQANAFLKTIGSDLGSFVAAISDSDKTAIGTEKKRKKKGWSK